MAGAGAGGGARNIGDEMALPGVAANALAHAAACGAPQPGAPAAGGRGCHQSWLAEGLAPAGLAGVAHATGDCARGGRAAARQPSSKQGAAMVVVLHETVKQRPMFHRARAHTGRPVARSQYSGSYMRSKRSSRLE